MTRDAEWDDEQRARMAALAEYEAGIHHCGFHRSLTTDPENGFTFEVDHCLVCAAAEQYDRQIAERDKREKEAAGENPRSLSSDGRSTLIRLMSDEEHAAAREKAQARAHKASATKDPPASTASARPRQRIGAR